MAVEALKHGSIRKIVLVRPAVEAGETILVEEPPVPEQAAPEPVEGLHPPLSTEPPQTAAVPEPEGPAEVGSPGAGGETREEAYPKLRISVIQELTGPPGPPLR